MSFVKEDNYNLIYTLITDKNIKSRLKNLDNLQIIRYPSVNVLVEDKDVVYLGSDEKYYRAIADGTEKENVVGIYDDTNKRIITYGIVDIGTNIPIGNKIYLSTSEAGKVQSDPSNVTLGISLGNGYILFDPDQPNYDILDTRYALKNDTNYQLDNKANKDLSNVNDSDILNKLVNVDGSGSGLDADKLDGRDSSDFANAIHEHDDRYYTKTQSSETIILNPNLDTSVQDKDFVYLNSDGKYYQALADGSEKENVIGIYDATNDRIVTNGIATIDISVDFGKLVYLSDVNPGKPQTDITSVKLGISLGNNIILLSSLGGSSNIDDENVVTFEDLEYSLLLQSNPFNNVYYDKFNRNNTINITQGTANYNARDSRYEISNTSTESCIFETDDIINDGNTYYRFLVHLDANVTPTVEYSIDQGNTWESCEIDEGILVSDGFTTLRLRFTFNDDGTFNSYGVCYNYDFNEYTSDTRMFEILTIDQDYTAPKEIIIPNGSTYTTNNKSLEIYLNRARLIPTVDYEEVDSRTVRFLVNLKQSDIVIFTEKYGYVDTSIDNQSRLDYEHNEQGQHIFTDLTTGIKYRLVVDNGSITLIKQ